MRGAIRRHSSASASRSLPEPIRPTSSTSFASISITPYFMCNGEGIHYTSGLSARTKGNVVTESARYPKKENADDRTRATALRKHERKFGNQIPGNTDPYEVYRRN